MYTNLFSKNNLSYYIDDILYLNKDNTTTKYDNVKFSYTKSNLKYLKGNKPTKPKQGELTQVAVSKGYLEQIIGINLDSAIFVNESNTKLSYNGTTSYNFYICGISRIPAPMEFNITGIVDSDELFVYAPSLAEYELYESWISSSFQEGGYLTAIISDDVNANSKVYRNLLNNKITINNPSFLKLQLVDDFVNDNLFLFAVLFFSFGLFSILMIFNFVIITIKNSTRDIGIYMSLGMNGLKISLIYLFQVIIISTISIIIGSIGSSILINQIDNSFSIQALIDFKILKNTALGYIISIVIAYLTPFIAIASPLLSLSRKKPIDVIKAA